jgi:hypothetical protein
VRLAEASSLVQLDFRKSKIFPFKLDRWNSGLVLCWQMFYRKHKLVIDGKYSSNDGLSTTPMINRQIEDKARKIE